MDIGVGAFIFSSGISSRPVSQSVKLYKGLVRSLQRNSILLTLGQHCSLHPRNDVMQRDVLLTKGAYSGARLCQLYTFILIGMVAISMNAVM